MIATIAITLAVAAAAIIRQERRNQNRDEIHHHYLQLLLLGNTQSERYLKEISQLSGSAVRKAAAEVVAELSPIIYKLDYRTIESISHSLRLSEFILSMTRKSRGVERTLYLSILSKIPPSTLDLREIEPYSNSEDRMMRFFALLAKINIDQDNALAHIANYDSPITPFELSQLLSRLRQGAITVAYQPLLSSQSDNLKTLGVAVVQHFGIESAEEQLREMIQSEVEYSIRRDALYALASMQLLLCSPSIKEFTSQMPHLDRRRFLRHIASVGYSQSTIDFFTSHNDRKYFHALINSYKIKIGCF